MSERTFRFIQGLCILIALYLDMPEIIYAYMMVILIEAFTNFRIPIVVSRLRYGKEAIDETPEASDYRFSFEAERMLRVVVFCFLLLTYVLFPEVVWFFPWFIGVMLLMAGITNICPMVMGMRYLGFR